MHKNDIGSSGLSQRQASHPPRCRSGLVGISALPAGLTVIIMICFTAFCPPMYIGVRGGEFSKIKPQVYEDFDALREEIAYLDDQHAPDDPEWNNYKTEVNKKIEEFKDKISSLDKDKHQSVKKLRQIAAKVGKIHKKMPLRLPSGPKGKSRFGAYYTTLKYDLQWDKLWKVKNHADVIVRFDKYDHRFVFWRGTSYIPCWATYDGAWYTNEFFERRGYLGGCDSMCEPMSDKQCRYSHPRIIETSNARVVIHWRYSPVDLNYKQPYRDPMTGWGDWCDEYYYIYPDSVGVRKATIHTSSPKDDWIEYQEGIVINQPGTIPEENINYDAVSFANLKGQSRTYRWTQEGGPKLEGLPEQPCIQVINFKNPYKPFTVVNPDGVKVNIYPDVHRDGKSSHFNWWNHWPVAQKKSDTTDATTPDRPSHSSLSHIRWKPYAIKGLDSTVRRPFRETWIMLHGMTSKPAVKLVRLAKSWLNAPELKLESRPGKTGCKGFISRGYDKTQRAYILKCEKTGKPSTLKMTLQAGKNSPVINPAFVIKNWGAKDADLKINGKKVTDNEHFRTGHRRNPLSSNLIVWIKYETTEPVTISLSPVRP